MEFTKMFLDPHCWYAESTVDLVLTRWWTWVSIGCSQILTVGIQSTGGSGFTKMVDMGFKRKFSYPQCEYTESTVDLVLTRWWTWVSRGCSQILTVGIQSTDGSGFN